MTPQTPTDRLRDAIAVRPIARGMAVATVIGSMRAEPLGSRFLRGLIRGARARLVALGAVDAREMACAALQGGMRDEGAPA